MVCSQDPANHARIPGAGRGAAKTLGNRFAHRAPLVQRHRRTNSGWREPLLAYAAGSFSSCRRGPSSKKPEPLGRCLAQTDRVVANAHARRRGRLLAQSCQVAPGPGPKLTRPRAMVPPLVLAGCPKNRNCHPGDIRRGCPKARITIAQKSLGASRSGRDARRGNSRPKYS